jgi:uncharacterized protein (TIGR02118 family)
MMILICSRPGAANTPTRTPTPKRTRRRPQRYRVAMIRFLVLYKQPTDTEAFDRHYSEVHIPLAKSLPELRSYTISRKTTLARGEDAVYLIAELDWDDMDAMQRAFGSPVGRECGKDVDELAKVCPDISSLIYEVETL